MAAATGVIGIISCGGDNINPGGANYYFSYFLLFSLLKLWKGTTEFDGTISDLFIFISFAFDIFRYKKIKRCSHEHETFTFIVWNANITFLVTF